MLLYQFDIQCKYLISYPANTDVPEVEVISPVNILKMVVLPAPLTPSNPKHSPFGIIRLTEFTASLHLL